MCSGFKCIRVCKPETKLGNHQSVLADNEQALGPVNLSQANFFIEGAVASQHHGDAVWEASLWDFGGRAQDRRGQVIDLKTRLKRKDFLALTGDAFVIPGPNQATCDLLPYWGPEAVVPTVSWRICSNPFHCSFLCRWNGPCHTPPAPVKIKTIIKVTS